MDYRVYHAINEFVARHDWLGRLFGHINSVLTILIPLAAALLWLLARPGGNRRWKLAATSALASGAVAYIANQVIAAIWHRDRPCTVHPAAHTWVTCKHDASFPSDHTSAAFAIAFAILLYDRVVGGLFLIAAAVLGVGRVLIGVHYPGDVLAGVLVGLAVAIVVARLARPLLGPLVRVVERATDPLVAPVWRRIGRV